MLERQVRFILAIAVTLHAGCVLGTKQQDLHSDKRGQSSAAVRVNLRSDAPIYVLNDQRGSLRYAGVARDLAGVAHEIGQATVGLEFVEWNDAWAWVGSLDEPYFVRRSDIAASPYADNPSHAYLKNHDIEQYAKRGLPLWIAPVVGQCPEFELDALGRLIPTSPHMKHATWVSTPGREDYPYDMHFISAYGHYVLGDGLTLSSARCLDAHVQAWGRFERVPDMHHRDAYVLGAGSDPMDAERGVQLMLLAQQYGIVYANDIAATNASLDTARVEQEYAERCQHVSLQAANGPSDRALEDFCALVTEAPTNIDFRHMRQPASSIHQVRDVDVLVPFPSPSWVEDRGMSDPHLLGTDIELILGKGSIAYIITEMDLAAKGFDHDPLQITELPWTWGRMNLHLEDLSRAPSLSFATDSQRWLTIVSYYTELFSEWPDVRIRVYRVTRQHT